MAVFIEPDCNDTVAHLPGVRRALKKQANRIAAHAELELASHRHEGHAEITVTRGDKVDYFVNLDDTRGDRAAAAIEFGHVAPDGSFVEGLHVLTGGLGR